MYNRGIPLPIDSDKSAFPDESQHGRDGASNAGGLGDGNVIRVVMEAVAMTERTMFRGACNTATKNKASKRKKKRGGRLKSRRQGDRKRD